MNPHVVWAAGLFEGEGCFQRNQKGASIAFGMRLVSTDRDVVEAYADVIESIVGRRPALVRRKRPQPHHKQQFAASIGGPDAERFYEAMRPWLGQRRTATADAIRAEVSDYQERLRSQRAQRPSPRAARIRRYWSGRRAADQEPLW